MNRPPETTKDEKIEDLRRIISKLQVELANALETIVEMKRNK